MSEPEPEPHNGLLSVLRIGPPGAGPIDDQDGRLLCGFCELSRRIAFFSMQPAIPGVGDGDVFPEDVGGRPEDGMVNGMGRDLKGKVLSLDGPWPI